MKTSSIPELKKELKFLSNEELIKLCIRLAGFKKENKELLTYLLFESTDEQGFIQSVKEELDGQFIQINTDSRYYIKKSCRRILKDLKKYARYSQKKETEVELLIYFCQTLKDFSPTIKNDYTLVKL